MNSTFPSKLISYASWGLAIYALYSAITLPESRFVIVHYMALACLIGITLDYLIPYSFFRKPLYRHLTTLLVVNVEVFLYNLLVSFDSGFYKNPGYWQAMGLISLILLGGNLYLYKKYQKEQVYLEAMVQQKIREMDGL